MLEQEYQPRRKPPRAALKPGTLPTQFTFTLGEATLEDMPAVLALYRHYVRNSVVTFDETPPHFGRFFARVSSIVRNWDTRFGSPSLLQARS